MAHGDDDDEADVDRHAILARRQRFIALALSSLAATCGDDGATSSTSPMPCLDVAPQTESASATTDGATATEGVTSTTTGLPMPCLGAVTETSLDPTGTGDSTTSTGTGTDGDTGTDGGSDSTGKPQPCLAPKG